MKSERGSYINIIINTRKLKLAYVINIVVELIWNDTEFGKLESSRKLPSLVVWVSAVPHKLMKPVSEKSIRTLHLESVSIICSSLSLSLLPSPPPTPLSPIILPFICWRCEHSGSILYPPQHSAALSVLLVDNQHLIGIQGDALLHLNRLHPQWIHEYRTGSGVMGNEICIPQTHYNYYTVDIIIIIINFAEAWNMQVPSPKEGVWGLELV